jgi:tRNA nucleotidyltransferase (CCA-adding enzyme)
MLVPTGTPRESLGKSYLEIAKEATYDGVQYKRFAEHPYLEAVLDGIRINIVPCYNVVKGKWLSATDRTPFHTEYVKPLLSKELRSEVRLLKQFMKGIEVYGAEIKVGGFSGYLCELLILYHGSFLNVLKAAADWGVKVSIDIEKYYEKDKLKQIFEESIIIVDPVDKDRNAASAVRLDVLNHFIAASRNFLENPKRIFFYTPEIKPLSSNELFKSFQERGTKIIFIMFEGLDVVPDVLWGQLYKSQKALRKLVNSQGFTVIRDAVWSNEKSLNFFIFELENNILPPFEKHLGPPLHKREDCRAFLKKHTKSTQTLSGPTIESNRWVVYTTRKNTDAKTLLKVKLKDGGSEVGIAEYVSNSLKKSLKPLTNEEIFPIYMKNPDFAEFLTDFLRGKPRWLT